MCLPGSRQFQRNQRDHIVLLKFLDNAQTVNLTDLSPYTLCLFLLGLAAGVLSLTRPASSISFSALLSAVGSTGSDPALSAAFILRPLVGLRFVTGGVLVSGETKVGVCEFPIVVMEVIQE